MTRAKGQPKSEEHKAAISTGMRKLWEKRKKQGYKLPSNVTEETRRKMSIARKLWWAKQKENQK